MHWIDWIIVAVPVLLTLAMAVYSKRYIRGVADYLAAGRVAGRYVMCVGSMEASLGVVFLVAMVEASYQTGFAMTFWATVGVPVAVMMSLTGYCTYRFRETRVLSIGQFLEMRYNRSFRVFASGVRTTAEMLTNAIGPAIAANFFIYYLGLPHRVETLGFTIPTFSVVVAVVLSMAVVVMWFGGRLSLLVTDCFQGLLSYPIFVLIVVYVLWHFSWSTEIAPVMQDRVPGESFLNPFDVSEMRDFNLFAVAVGIFGSILNRASWAGNDASTSGRTPHEQQMAGILAAWRGGFSALMCLVIAVAVITFMSHAKYASQAREVRADLVNRVADEVVTDPAVRADLAARVEAVNVQPHRIGVDPAFSRVANPDTPYLNAAREAFPDDGSGNLLFQKFRTLYHQMMMPMTLRELLPVGLTGVFCLLMVMLMLATDTSRIFNSSATLVQDVVLPLKKGHLTPDRHLLWLRIGSVAVAGFFFFCSLFFVQVDFVWMLITILAAIWLGGAGPVMVFGLYSRFGNTVGAYASVLVGSSLSLAGLLLQHNWADTAYPFLARTGWLATVTSFFDGVTAWTAPYVVWQMNPVKFPINSTEILFIAMVSGIVAYTAGSLLTYRGPFNLERMLYRGPYAAELPADQLPVPAEGNEVESSTPTPGIRRQALLNKLIGIGPEFTRGDRILAWSVFLYSFVYQVGICFVVVLIWNLFSPWPIDWWSKYFYITSFVIAAIIGVISTVWFLIGGTIDTRRLFRDLANRVDDPLDDGRVSYDDHAAATPSADRRAELSGHRKDSAP